MNCQLGISRSRIPSKEWILAVLKPFLVLFLLFMSSGSDGQIYRSVRISLAQGLSQSTVYGIAQDSPGFLWVATQDGLNKYDGNSFETYYNQPFDSASIPSSNVMTVFCDSKNRLWVGTMNSGLSLFNRTTKSFTTFSESARKGSINDNSVFTICEDADGTIWVGTSLGLNRLFETKNAQGNDSLFFESINVGNDSLLRNTSVIFSEKPGVLWIGTKKGLCRLTTVSNGNQQNNSIKVFTSENGIGNNYICDIVKDKNGNLIAVTKTGISIFDPVHEKFISYKLSDSKEKQIYVNCATLFSDNYLWLGCSEGVFRLNTDKLIPDKGNIIHPENIISRNSFSVGAIISLKEDKINKGIAWLGSEANGLTKLVPVTKNFYSDDLKDQLDVPFVYSLLKDSSILWIGTTSGLIRKNLSSGKSQLFSVNTSSDDIWASDYINHLLKDRSGNLWTGTSSGLFKIEKPYSLKPGFRKVVVNKSVPTVGVRDLYMDVNGQMFVVMPRKVFQFDPQSDESKLIISLDELKLSDKVVISSMVKDNNNNLFVGTSQGLLVFKYSSNKYNYLNPFIIRYQPDDTTSMRCDNVYNLTSDPDNSIWIATANGLTNLKFISESNYTLRNFSRKNGMKNNAIYAVQVDSIRNSIWFSTNGGLTKFDKVSNRFFNYDLHDGLQSNEFNAGAGFISESGELFFGGVNGYTSFKPWEIRTDTVKPHLAITKFQILGSDAQQALSLDGKVELKHYNNSFSIEFVALQFSNPAKNQYAYMLEGYQKEWTNLGTTNKVIFSNLPPGEFVFRVIGSNEDGIFNSTGEKIIICISPPFYKTIWFYLALVFVVGSILWLMHVYRLKFKMKQLAAVEKIRTDTAADFHDELGHKLTTISWFSEIMKRKLNPDQSELKGYLDKITGTTGALYHTMRDLLWAMDPEKDSLYDLYKQLREFGESLFDQTDFRFVSMDDNPAFKNDTIPFEQKRHVLLIFKEVMNNSFKHSKATTVSLNAIRENNHYTLIVTDDGSGITTEASQYGNGLKNVYKRSGLINGDLKISSTGKGTIIELSVPLTN